MSEIFRGRAFSALLLQLFSLWPVIRWTLQRSVDGSDEPLGLIALATVMGILTLRMIRGASRNAGREASLAGPALSAVYAVGLLLLPLPVASLIGLLALALTASRALYGTTLNLGLLGLLWLSVPLIGTFDFYLGYPLRWLTTEGATLMLRLSGNDVTRRGVSLLFAEREVSVDPACAGLRMLWMTAYSASLLACMRPLCALRMVLFAGAAFGLLVVANAWRAASLFYVEAGIIRVPPWGHEAVGALVLLSLLVAVAVVHRQLARCNDTREKAHAARVSVQCEGSDSEERAGVSVRWFERKWRGKRQLRERVGQVLALGALVGTFVPAPHQPKILAAEEPRWPSEYEGERLEREPMPAELSAFYGEFPGSVAFFRSAHRRYVFRHVTQPTRRLHPAEHCFRGEGYEVEPAQICGSSFGARFGCFSAARGDERVLVKERIVDSAGRAFTDVSSWYWAAWLGRTHPPWISVTLVERRESAR